MAAWGQDCSAWDDAVDAANLQQFDHEDIPDDEFVMTTWHIEDSLEELFFFAKNSAKHPSLELRNTLMIHISATDRGEEFSEHYGSA